MASIWEAARRAQHYGAASSLITLLLWIYYASQVLLFGAEFTQVYANTYGTRVEPMEHAVKVEERKKDKPVTFNPRIDTLRSLAATASDFFSKEFNIRQPSASKMMPVFSGKPYPQNAFLEQYSA